MNALLPARRGYATPSDELDANLKAASRRVLEAETEAEREAGEADVVAAWKAIEDYEADARQQETEEAFETSGKGSLAGIR